MDRTLDIRTPESIAFSYELAGIGSRFLAVAIDLAAQIGILALMAWGFYLLGTSGTALKAARHAGSDQLTTSLATALVIAVVFVIFFGYFILFEALWNGQTPGKRALGLRVVRDGGYPVDFTAALVRNLIRVGELTFGAYTIAGVAAMISPENKRLGDMAAGTIVVRDARMSDGSRILESLATQPHYAATAYVSGDERALIKRFLERRFDLAEDRRRALAAQITDRIRPRMPAELAALDDESLLERL